MCRLIWKILHERVRYEEQGPAASEAAKKVGALIVRHHSRLSDHRRCQASKESGVTIVGSRASLIDSQMD